MKFDKIKVCPWINLETEIPQFGVDVKINGSWKHLAIDGKALFFDTKEEAQKYVREHTAKKEQHESK